MTQIRKNLLVVDDQDSVLRSVRAILSDPAWDVHLFQKASDALARLENEHADLAISDVRMPEVDGFGFVDEALRIQPDLPILVFSGYSSVSDAVTSLELGAVEYLPKPFSAREFRDTVRHLLAPEPEVEDLDEAARVAIEPILGRSPALLSILPQIPRFARSGATALVHAETGSGKELVARAIHAAGPRAAGPYVVCNCSAFADSLMEREFFGHARGAFTDADADHPGLFECADGGVLFLDEIGDLPLDSQAKLLRLLDTGEFQRIGETRTRRSDVQIVAATNKDLAREAAEGRFREDLLYRLRVAEIRLPPLRERREDIPLLLRHFAQEASAELGKECPKIDAAALRALERHSWPGNVRELRNVVYRALLFHEGGTLRKEDLPESIRASTPAPGAEAETLEAVRRRHIRRVLERAGGNKTEAARILGVSRVSLYRELERDPS